jgi:subtilisin family serine protease
MVSLIKALPLVALFISSVHASPYALRTVPRQLEDAVDTSESSASIFNWSQTEDKLYIVAFEDGKTYDESFLEEVSAATGATATLETDLTGVIFNGVSIQLSGDGLAELDIEAAILELDGVFRVFQDQPLTPPSINVTSSLRYDESRYSNDNARLAAADPVYTNDKIMMQIDKLQAAGYTGKGIKVAVMDNAIDTRHPAIKVDYVFDYRHPEDIGDPTPSCMSHATACGGLVSSQPGPNGFHTGAAPGVTLGNYILGGCKHGGHSGLVLQALEQAVIDRTNVLSISLGYGDAWKFLDDTKTFTKVAEAGVLLVIAAGNGGHDGLYRVSQTCTAPGVLCVGMLTNTVVNTWETRSQLTINGQQNAMQLGWLQSKIDGGWSERTLPIWSNIAENAGGWGGHGGDGCQVLPNNVPDLSNYVVLIRRNLCNEDDMIDRVAAAGAKYILIAELYEGFEDVFNPDIRREHPDVTALGTISGVQGIDIVRALREGKKVEVNMQNPTLALKERQREENGQPIGDVMDPGSQWGPTFDAGATTDVSAPGTDIPILAPIGSDGGIYGTASGTSLATPLVAGAAALVMEALGTTDPKIIAHTLIHTSKLLARRPQIGDGLASVLHQGGGLIRPLNAIAIKAVIDRDIIEFNDTSNRRTQSFTITNRGSSAITYRLTNVVADSIYSFGADEVPFPPGGNDVIQNELYVNGTGASLRFSSNSVTVPRNGRTTVTVTATDPSLNRRRLPIWSGFIKLAGSDGNDLTLPYFGFAGDVDRVPKVFKSFVRENNVVVPSGEVIIETHHGMGTRKLQYYLVNARTNQLAHPTPMYQFDNVGVTAYTIGWRGDIDGTQIPAGEYKLRLRSLRAFGQPGSTNDNDYVIFESPSFTFRR